jgi:hypothetical protein
LYFDIKTRNGGVLVRMVEYLPKKIETIINIKNVKNGKKCNSKLDLRRCLPDASLFC